MSEKVDMKFTEEEFRSVIVNVLADMQTEFVTLRIIFIETIAGLRKQNKDEVQAEFNILFKTTRADILSNMLSKYT